MAARDGRGGICVCVGQKGVGGEGFPHLAVTSGLPVFMCVADIGSKCLLLSPGYADKCFSNGL